MLRVRPYRTNDNKIEGVVVVLLDIDQLRRGEQELRDARDFSRSVLESVPLPLAVVDLELRVRAANDAFRALAGVTGEQIDRRSLPDLAAVAWGLDEPLRQRLEELRAAAESNTHARFEFDFTVPGGKSKVFQVRGRVLKPDSGMFLLVTLEDVTPQLEATRMLAEDRERLSREAETAARELGRTQENLRALAGSLLNSQENERRRVARELHDDICQKLAALEISAQQVAQRMAGHPEEAFAELEHVRAGISSLSDDVRSISHRIHPAVIEDLGLVPALRGLVEDFREREHMIATFSARGVRDHLPVEIASGLYRIAQEALRNVAKHAGKTHVKVALSGNTEAIRLQVIDAGEGFDIHERRSGLGLISMEERTRMMRGAFRIQSELGEGTRVVVDVPLAETASE
jgi:two-component system, chemotaxis family, CheB/CheR fusion protein